MSASRTSVLCALACIGVVAPAQAQLPVYDAAGAEAAAPPEAAARAEAAAPPEAAAPAVGSASSQVAREVAPAKKEMLTYGPPPIDDDEEDDRPLEPRRVWYGWQTLIVDGAAFSALLVGAAANGSSGGDDGSALIGVGLLGYEFAPGIVHFVHRNPGRGFASFGVRFGMPLAGAVLGASLASNCDGYHCEEDGAAVGLLLGMAGAIALDAAVFAYDSRKPAPRGSTTTLMPMASWLPGRAWVGIAGSL